MSMQMRRILGNPEALKVVKAVPFEPGVVDFLDAVSKAIRSIRIAERFRDCMPLGSGAERSICCS